MQLKQVNSNIVNTFSIFLCLQVTFISGQTVFNTGLRKYRVGISPHMLTSTRLLSENQPKRPYLVTSFFISDPLPYFSQPFSATHGL